MNKSSLVFLDKRRGFTTSMKTRRGFTLIELMVAISIVAILATIGIGTYSQAQVRGRDLKRKQDLRAIALGLELYYRSYNHFPCTTVATPWVYSSTTPNTSWLTNDSTVGVSCGGPAAAQQPFNQNFISAMPNDPVRNTSGLGTGGYFYTSSTGCANPIGSFYILLSLLENANDPEVHSKMLYKDCSGAALNQGAYGANSFIIVGQ